MTRRKKVEVDEMFVDEALALVALVAGQEVESEVEKTQVTCAPERGRCRRRLLVVFCM